MLPSRVIAILLAGFALSLTATKSGHAAEPPTLTDLYGDPLPLGAMARLGTVRWRPQNGVSQMAFVPGGRYLVTTWGSALSVWDVDTGRLVRTISTDGTPAGHGFQSFAFTPDGKYVVSADYRGSPAPGGERKSRLFLWEFSSGKALKQSDLSGDPDCLAIGSDGRVAACATSVGDVFLWDIEKNGVRRVVQCDQRTMIKSMSFAAADKQLVVLPDEDGMSRRIDVASGKVLKKVELGKYGRVALATGEGTVATYSYPDQLYLYDTNTGVKRRLALKEKVNFLDLSFSPDGRTLLAMDRDAEVVQFWDVAKGQLLKRLRVPGVSGTYGYAELLLSGDGKTLASNEEHSVVRIWDAQTGQPRLDFPGHVEPPVHLAFSADGKELVSHAHRDGTLGGQLYRWDATTGKSLACVSPDAPKEGWPGSNMDWRLGPGGRHLAERVGEATYIYEGSTGKRLVLAGKSPPKSAWTFSPDGRALVTIGADQEVCLWDVTSGKLLRQLDLEKKGAPISWLQLTPDARTLAAGEGWEKVNLWDATTGKHQATLMLPAEREPYQKPLNRWQTAFTPDGRFLFASVTTSLWIWDMVGRREIGPFEQDKHEMTVVCTGPLAVSPDGRMMAWFDRAFKLRLYEVCTGKIVYRFTDDYSSIAFAPSGWQLATGCDADSSVLIWDLPQLFRSQPPLDKDNNPEALWADLRGDDAVRAYRAVWRLAALPEADGFLARHLKPVEGMPSERLRALVADLGSPNFDKRESAENALAQAGEAASAAFAEASAQNMGAETRRRLARLQARLDPRTPERLREARAILALEARGTVEARQLLQRLAAGLSDARMTQGAKKALERLPK